jgi:hypothetical protein
MYRRGIIADIFQSFRDEFDLLYEDQSRAEDIDASDALPDGVSGDEEV